MKYMLMMHAPRGTGDYQVSEWSPADFEAHMAFMFRIQDELKSAGEWVDGQGLASPGQAVLVRAGANGAPVTDGPFAEAKEFLAGYWIIDVEDKARAISRASQFSAAPGPGGKPLNMAIEVRQVMSVPPGQD